MGCAGAVRAYRSAERMIEGLCVRAAHFHLSLDEPFPRLLIEAWRITVVVLIVAVIFVPTGVDDGDVAGTDLGTRLLQIFRSDDFPLFLRNGHHDAGPEEIRQRNCVHERRSLNDVGRGIDVSARVHHGRDSLRQYAGLRHTVKPLDLDVLEIRPAWLPKSPGVAQVVKLQSHTVEKIGFLELTKIRIAPIAVLPTSHVVPLMYRTVGIVYGHTVRHRDALRQDITAKAPCSRATSASLMIQEYAGSASRAAGCNYRADSPSASRTRARAARRCVASFAWTLRKRVVGTGIDKAIARPIGSRNPVPTAEMPSVCSSLSIAMPVVRQISIALSSSEGLVIVFGVTLGIGFFSSRATLSSLKTLKSALPLAVQWSGKDSPIDDTARRRWTPCTWSVKTATLPLSTDRSTVSPTACESSEMIGRVIWSNSTLAEAASRMRAGPRRTPAVSDAAITNCSVRRASTMRCTVDRARPTRSAI